MTQRDAGSLLDMLLAARYANRFCAGISKAEFLESELLQSAVLYKLEIVGEAISRVSIEFRDSNPNIPWRKIAALRNIVIHAYDKVDLDEIWDIVHDHVPVLIAELAAILLAAGYTIPPERT